VSFLAARVVGIASVGKSQLESAILLTTRSCSVGSIWNIQTMPEIGPVHPAAKSLAATRQQSSALYCPGKRHDLVVEESTARWKKPSGKQLPKKLGV